MPAYVKHEKDWERARQQADRHDLSKSDGSYWKYVSSIYKKMHPEDFNKEASAESVRLICSYRGDTINKGDYHVR